MNFPRFAAVPAVVLTALLAVVTMPTLAAEPPAASAATTASASGSPDQATPPGRAASAILIDEFTGTGAPRAGEPAVQKTVIEDDITRIDELRVRGQLTRIVVTSKGGAGSYEIITGDGSRDLSNGRNTNRGAAGQRVWSVLRF